MASLRGVSPDFRKVALIAATLGLLVSLFVALRSGDGEDGTGRTTAAAARTAEPTLEPLPATTGPARSKGPGTIHLDYVVSGGRPEGGIARDSISRGRIVVLRVTSDVADEVHLHGYDERAQVAPGEPATIRFVADVPGRFELELEETGVPIGELEVRP